MSVLHIIGIVITLASIVALSIYSGKATKEKKGAGAWVVSGAIMGTLVGGSSTVGDFAIRPTFCRGFDIVYNYAYGICCR